MKIGRTIIAIIVLMVFGMALVLHLLIRQDHMNANNALERRGYHLTGLLALHAIDEFQDDRRNFLLKSFLEHSVLQDMCYFYIHRADGTPVVALNHHHSESRLPTDVRNRSLSSNLFLQQTYAVDAGQQIHEFAKPVFEKGVKTGTIRLGLYKPAITILSLERVSLLAMMAFFVLSGAVVVYYGFIQTLKALIKIKDSIIAATPIEDRDGMSADKSVNVMTIEKDFSEKLGQVKQYLGKIQHSNDELVSRMGVVQYEKAQIDRVLNNIRMGIIITDFQFNIIHINRYMLNLLGLKISEAMDQPIEKIVAHPQLLDYVGRGDPSDASAENSHMDITWPELAPGETYRLSCSFLPDGANRPAGKMVLLKNVTREKTMDGAVKNFTTHLSHELLTPLATIQSYSEMLVDGEVEDIETNKEFYNTIHEETVRLSRLVKDILCFASIENGNLTIEKGLVRSDWLYKEESDMVVFDIQDNGFGINEADLPNIFKKYFRSEDPAITEQPGTGLGLAIASEIISLHGGKIDVESRIGEGSRFRIMMPKEEYSIEKEYESFGDRR